MITVRLPNGTRLRYNNAHFVGWHDNHWALWDRNPSKARANFIVGFPPSAGVIVEYEEPCEVTKELTSILRDVAEHPEQLRGLPGKVLCELKRALQKFNMQTWNWKR